MTKSYSGESPFKGQQYMQIPARDRQALDAEASLCEPALATHPWEGELEHAKAWGAPVPGTFPGRLAISFQRARTVMQACNTARVHWLPRVGMDKLVDAEGPSAATASRLAQLVVWSRVGVYHSDTRWTLPIASEVEGAIDQVREELGVTELWKLRRRVAAAGNVPAFPGQTHETLALAILTGRVGVGNSDQPSVVCYQK